MVTDFKSITVSETLMEFLLSMKVAGKTIGKMEPDLLSTRMDPRTRGVLKMTKWKAKAPIAGPKVIIIKAHLKIL